MVQISPFIFYSLQDNLLPYHHGDQPSSSEPVLTICLVDELQLNLIFYYLMRFRVQTTHTHWTGYVHVWNFLQILIVKIK
jgi:hypothetical protein